MLNFMKFRQVGTEIHACGQTDGDDKTNSPFAIFPTPKNPTSSPCPGPLYLQLGHKSLSKLSQKKKKTLIIIRLSEMY